MSLKKIGGIENLTDRAYQVLKDYIVSLPMNADVKLSETRLAAELGISKTPVREALRQLATEGLIDIQSRRGTFLVKFSSEDVKEIFDIREYLEALAVNELITKVTDEDIKKLTKLLTDSSSSALAGDKTKYSEIDADFHALLVSLSGNTRLYRIFTTIQAQIQGVRTRSIRLPGRPDKSNKEHWELLKALQERDQETAEKVIREHIRNVKEDLLANFQQAGRPAKEN